MKQIYNLLETIKDDKERVEACEKHLRYLKGQLSVHEDALKRITSIPEGQSLKGIASSKDNRVRITQDNWKSLGIEVGDTVEIVVSGDADFEDNSKCQVSLLNLDATYSFMELVDHENIFRDWYCYNRDEQGEDELYLIKQPS